jgi:hypothetical protein
MISGGYLVGLMSHAAVVFVSIDTKLTSCTLLLLSLLSCKFSRFEVPRQRLLPHAFIVVVVVVEDGSWVLGVCSQQPSSHLRLSNRFFIL